MRGSPITRPAPELPPGPRLALVIATASYTDAGLRQLRAPAQDATDFAEALADTTIGGFAVITVIDRPAGEIRLAVSDFLEGRHPDDLLLVYLSCHGLLDARRRLYFATVDTRKDRLAATGIESQWLLEQLDECRARRQVLVLDCCFSGAFAHNAKGETDLDLRHRLVSQGRGRVVLTASRATEYSFEGDPVPERPITGSVFTTALVKGLRTGAADTDHDGLISVDDAYTYAYQQVSAEGTAQTPQRWLYGAEGQLLLARNPSGRLVTPTPLPDAIRIGLDSPHPDIRIGGVIALGAWLTDPDPARALAAQQTLHNIANSDIPRVAATAAAFLANTSTGIATVPAVQASAPGAAQHQPYDVRADGTGTRTVEPATISARTDSHSGLVARLLSSAETTAYTIEKQDAKVSALIEVAKVVAATDPARADRLLADAQTTAYAIEEQDAKVSALVDVAKVVAATDLARADRLLTDGEATARAMPDNVDRASALSEVAKAAATDSDRAELIAHTIAYDYYRGSALADIAKVVAATDTGRAERIAHTISDEDHRGSALADIAKVVAATDTGRAERIAHTISGEFYRAWALADVANVLAATDTERAARLLAEVERIADGLTDAERIGDGRTEYLNARMLSKIAMSVADLDQEQAARLIEAAERVARTVPDELYQSWALADVAEVIVATDPSRAERIAHTIPDEDERNSALADLVAEVAATDPSRAERIAHTIPDEFYRAWTLANVANVLMATDTKRAARMLTEVERIAWAIADEGSRVSAMAGIAEVFLSGQPRDDRERPAPGQPPTKLR